MNTEGKKILVTGGALRIGQAFCRWFATLGADVIIHCNHSIAEAKTLAGELKKHFPDQKFTVIQADFTDAEALKNFFDRTGPVDILINNASVYDARKIQDEDLAHCRGQFEVNFFSPLTLMHEFYNSSPEGSCIINMLDQEVDNPTGRGGGYSISKKALRDATCEAAKDFAPKVRVNGIAPGQVMPPHGMEGSTMVKT